MNKIVLEKKASDFRNNNWLGEKDAIDLKSLLRRLNVLTIFKPLGDSFSGMSIKIEDGLNIHRFILINSSHSIGKQNFTICHELYHLFVQENFDYMYCNTGLYPKSGGEELNADIFASNLLLPEYGIKSMVPDNELSLNKIKLKTILKIEHYYSCSRAALLYRLKDLGIINSRGYENFKNDVKLSALLHGYNTSIYEAGNDNLIIGDYGTLARDLFTENKISESHYHSLLFDLGLDVNEIERLQGSGE